MKILDGKALSEKIYSNLLKKTTTFDTPPCLVVVLVGDDPASAIYVKNKEMACGKAGINSKILKFESNIEEDFLVEEIYKLNNDQSVTGFIVQVPLPNHISEKRILDTINPKKDMDGFHPNNLGNVYLGKNNELLPPATPKGIITLLESNNINISGKNIVVLGRSNNVGKAVAVMLLNRNATVTVCHSKTNNIIDHTKMADIIIVCVGQPKFLKSNMVKKGVVIIDVGIHKLEKDVMLCGDVDFHNMKDKASFISPVPGGVGPMTVASLIENTVNAYEKEYDK
jgi:methylenetetrahydrofolate dehydrogenase (NADP+)/methenyltetrahydrofolate cyclohydrolase